MKLVLFTLIFTAASVLTAGDFTTFNTSNSGLGSNTVQAIVIDPNGVKWFGADNGLYAFDGAAWTTFVKDGNKQTLADNNIHDIAFEQASTGPELWIATENGASVMGIKALDAVTKATPYRTDNTDLLDNQVTAVAVDPVRGERWFGTHKGVSRFSASGWRNFTTESEPPLAWDDVTAIGVDPDSGWKYICTVNGGNDFNGVSRLRSAPDNVDAITAPSPYNVEWSGLYSANVTAIFIDADGTQWFGTDVGFAYHDTTETKAYWDIFTEDEGLINNDVRAVFKSDDGIAWIGTMGGLERFDYQFGEYGIEIYKFTHFTTADGLASNHVFDIAPDVDGSLWIATDNGVSHYTGKTKVEKKQQAVAAKSYGLIGNYPNPFNPSTTIAYSLRSNAHVSLHIINMNGEIICTLVSTNQAAGRHATNWNGRRTNGQPAPSGIYMAILETDTPTGLIRDSIKLLLVK